MNSEKIDIPVGENLNLIIDFVADKGRKDKMRA
jgi:hypothetical protein